MERAIGLLEANQIDGKLVDYLKRCIEKCEFARFAPGSDGVSGMNDMYHDLTNVIIELEKSLSAKKYA